MIENLENELREVKKLTGMREKHLLDETTDWPSTTVKTT